jgi:hypothetical protein
MELPSHPEADDSPPGQEPATGSWATVLIVAVVVAVLAVIVILHLTGVVGPGAN